MLQKLIYILNLTNTIQSLSLRPIYPRNVVRNLIVNNGGKWGDWHDPDFCAEGSFAVGYNMKIEPRPHRGDGTGLNAILLRCESVNGSLFGDVTIRLGHMTSLPRFPFKSNPVRHGGSMDDTAANYVKFMCRDFKSDRHQYELVRPPGQGHWGDYRGWSKSCPVNSAICGIQTLIEKPQCNGDGTGLNDVILFCCE
ncbi:hypothetical protein ACJMK2_022525 [Sinanodonta woodiana]|uniref:Uncharacterized protein n=1 Tax=Sinanodonta woodiana TaxID=1069815 RepID=A0ABD3TK46_SINWO